MKIQFTASFDVDTDEAQILINKVINKLNEIYIEDENLKKDTEGCNCFLCRSKE